MFKLIFKMALASPDQWLNQQNITELNEYICSSFPELKHFMSTYRPDVMNAIENKDWNKLKVFTNELRAKNPFLKIDCLSQFLLGLQRYYSDFNNQKEIADQKLCLPNLPFIECRLNGKQVVGLIDTGAQHSVISQDLVKVCNILHLVDQRYKNKAVGVGEEIIIGKIHSTSVEINGSSMAISLMVFEKFRSNYFLIGHDFLSRNNCVVYCGDGYVFFKDLRLFVKIKS